MENNFFGMRLKILAIEKSDEDAKKADESWQTFKDDEANYGIIPYKEK